MKIRTLLATAAAALMLSATAQAQVTLRASHHMVQMIAK